ncbi:MAG: SDR family NAD(P)-dependent oxidoreductase [Polyangiaceae bacterium]|nr:SDR family NAD(P)-dependent oxidoreductase [Polyangiaceae bacterium]
MKIVVIGATGGSGRAAVERLVAEGHEVTAFSRNADPLREISSSIRVLNGDVMNEEDLDRAIAGQDAVVVTLGISESALRVRLFGAAKTRDDVRSAGTRNVIRAMRRHGVQKLVVQTSFGVGETKTKLPFIYDLMFKMLLKQQIADTERQEEEVRASGLDWVLAQPVNLTDAVTEGPAFASAAGETRSMKISRREVGRFLAEAAQSSAFVGRSVALSSV